MVKQMLPLSPTFPLNSLNVYPKLTICNCEAVANFLRYVYKCEVCLHTVLDKATLGQQQYGDWNLPSSYIIVAGWSDYIKC